MNAKVLVIEDNPANLELAQYLLRAHGHSVLTATNGEEGLRVLRQDRPDFIVCDLQMPVMDGYEFIKELRNNAALSSIPVVAVTAFSMPGDRQDALSAGFNGYISKPIDPETFCADLERFLPKNLRATPNA